MAHADAFNFDAPARDILPPVFWQATEAKYKKLKDLIAEAWGGQAPATAVTARKDTLRVARDAGAMIKMIEAVYPSARPELVRVSLEFWRTLLRTTLDEFARKGLCLPPKPRHPDLPPQEEESGVPA